MTEPTEGSPLTDREFEILRGMAAGHSNRVIGEQLGIAEDTCKSHARRMFRKLGASDRAQAVALAYQRGILDAGEPIRTPPVPKVIPEQTGYSWVTPSGDPRVVLAPTERDADFFARAIWGASPGRPVPEQYRVRVLEALKRVVGA